jgi:tRNA(Ile)-lysidine synthase
VILNLCRGTGVAGLAGIPEKRSGRKIVRPILFAERTEIETYAASQNIAFRNDSSNATDHYRRNIIRHHVVPILRSQINPSLSRTLLATGSMFRDLDAYLSTAARKAIAECSEQRESGGASIETSKLAALPVLLRQYVVRFMIQDSTGDQADHTLVDAVLDLHHRDTGSWVPLSGTWIAYRDRDRIHFKNTASAELLPVEVNVDASYDFGAFTFGIEEVPGGMPRESEPGRVEFVDADKVGGRSLVLRQWSEGESFVPLGMDGSKKVSDFLIDSHVPRFEKRQYPILSTPDGTIVWLLGQRIDERFKITPQTRRILKLSFQPEARKDLHAPRD